MSTDAYKPGDLLVVTDHFKRDLCSIIWGKPYYYDQPVGYAGFEIGLVEIPCNTVVMFLGRSKHTLREAVILSENKVCAVDYMWLKSFDDLNNTIERLELGTLVKSKCAHNKCTAYDNKGEYNPLRTFDIKEGEIGIIIYNGPKHSPDYLLMFSDIRILWYHPANFTLVKRPSSSPVISP